MADTKIPLTPVTIPEKGPLTGAQNMMLCAGCVRCCTYVAVVVDAPDTPWQYDQYVWLLEHRNIWMYVERGNHWYVQFETVCERLSPEGRCTIHGKHPVLCKKYDARNCERRGELSDVIARFRQGPELVAWLETKRPKHYARYMKWWTAEHANTGEKTEGAATKPRPIKMSFFEMPPPPVSPFAETAPKGAEPPLRRVVKKTTRQKA